MRISLNWLQQYIEIPWKPEDLAERLTMVGLEVESIERLGNKYRGFVIGKVLEVKKHPNAERLTVCNVYTGKENIQIVCGAPNVAPGQKVAVGLVGTEVPRNQHDPNTKPFIITKLNIRGVESNGMICSAYELDLGEDKDGILVFDQNAKVGISLAKYLDIDDVVLDIGITPNRPDCMSHIGIAREVAAITGAKVKSKKPKPREGKTPIAKYVAVKIMDRINCPRYTCRVLLGVTIEPSPKWMQNLLSAVGIRPINNIVDITNFVLMEIGQPLHAFDYDQIVGQEIVVKTAQNGEKFVTLDHEERLLRSDTLMICDTEKAVAVAGVMGGLTSEISDTTKNVLLESAYFKPQSIRRTSKVLGLSTEASRRFERGTDPNITLWAANRATELMHEICGGEILKGWIDIYPQKITNPIVPIRVKKANDVLGTNLNKQMVTTYLKRLGLKPLRNTKKRNGTIYFKVPTFRPDLEREIDLIEETARMYGYDKIETKTKSSIQFSEKPYQKEIVDIIRDWLIGRGFNEVVANSLQEQSYAVLTSDRVVKISNPISKEMEVMRTSLIPGLLHIIRHNISHGVTDIRLFEIGKIYMQDRDTEKILEENRLLVVLSGKSHPLTWDTPQRTVDLYDLRGELESLFQKIFLDNYKFIPYSGSKALTQTGLDIEIKDTVVGHIGKVSEEMLKKFEIEQDVFVVEVSIDYIQNVERRKLQYKPLPRYPSVMRDIALVVDESVPIESLTRAVYDAGGITLKSVELFDIYRGNQIAAGKKSCAFALEFQSEEKTLAQEEIDVVMQTILHNVSSKFQATLRM